MAYRDPVHMVGFVLCVSWSVVSLYFLSCCLPCIDCGPAVAYGDLDFHVFERGTHFGFTILFCGWHGGNNGVPWSANLFLGPALACFLLRRFRTALVLSFIASALALTTWWVRNHDNLVAGYYVWQASHLLLMSGAIFALWRFPGVPPLTWQQALTLGTEDNSDGL